MRSRTSILALVALIAMFGIGFGQGEGNGLDAQFDTAVNIGNFDATDKTITEGDILGLRLSTNTLLVGTPILVLTVLDDQAPQPMANFGIEPGILGVDPNGNSFLVFDGFSVFTPAVFGLTGELNFAVVIPAGVFVDPFEDFTVQGLVFDPTSGGPQNFAVTNTTRQHIIPAPVLFTDDCASAAAGVGLSDADLGNTMTVDTTAFTNTVEVSFGAPLDGGVTGTTTNFSLESPGNGVSQQAPEAFTKFTATGGGLYTFSLCGSNYDSTIYVIGTDCTTPIIFNDDHESGNCGGSLESEINDFPLSAGQQVIVCIDGFGATSSGNAMLTITQTPNVVSLTGITPANGPEAGANTVTISGLGLGAVNSVDFGGNPGTMINVLNGMAVEVNVPMGTGVVDVTVGDGVTMDTLLMAYTYNPAGQIVNSFTLGDDAFIQHPLTQTITYGGVVRTDAFIGSNGFVTFGAGSGDFTETLGEFFDDFGAGSPNPGVALIYSDLNRGGVTSGATYDVIEDTGAGTVEFQFNNQVHWSSQEPAGSVSCVFGTNTVDLDYTAFLAATTSTDDVIIGLSDGNAGVGTDTDLSNGLGTGIATALPYTSPGSDDSVGELVPANTAIGLGMLSAADATGTFNWTLQ